MKFLLSNILLFTLIFSFLYLVIKHYFFYRLLISNRSSKFKNELKISSILLSYLYVYVSIPIFVKFFFSTFVRSCVLKGSHFSFIVLKICLCFSVLFWPAFFLFVYLLSLFSSCFFIIVGCLKTRQNIFSVMASKHIIDIELSNK